MSSGLSLSVIALVGALGWAGLAHAQRREPAPHVVEGFGIPVSMGRLTTVRGGFDLGEGLNISFGIERAIYVDGNLVTYLNVTIPDVAHITAQQAMSLATALSTVTVQVGSGNAFDPSSATTASASQTAKIPLVIPVGSNPVGASMTQASTAAVIQNALNNPVVRSSLSSLSSPQTSAATVIQNTVDNQIISSLTTLNVAVNTLNAFRNQGLQQSLQAAQWQALPH